MDRLGEFGQIKAEDICWALKIFFFIKKILTRNFGLVSSEVLPTIVDNINTFVR